MNPTLVPPGSLPSRYWMLASVDHDKPSSMSLKPLVVEESVVVNREVVSVKS